MWRIVRGFYRPQTKFAEVMFLQVSVCPQGGACMVARGVCGCSGGGMRGCSGGMRGCSRGGACVVARGACVVALGGCAWLLGGACMVAPGGACMVARGGMRGCSRGGVRGFFHEIRSMSGRYASYWNAFSYINRFDVMQNLTFRNVL